MLQIENLGKQYAGRALFTGLSWHLADDARVGLVGPNGAGKTTLLRILAGEESADAGTIRRPRNLRIGYLPQEVGGEAVAGSILAQVLDASAPVRELEEQLESLEQSMGRADGAEQERLIALYGELRHRFEALGGYTLEAEARRILGGLGLPEGVHHQPVASLSGGFRMRVALARLLLVRPEVLLLDEPTNHLDLESLEWLEEFLREYDGAVVVVSHDRFFLNRMVAEIAELADGQFSVTPGDYDDYLEMRELRREQLEAAARQQARRVAEIEAFIERFRAKATKARQAQSRIKMLERMERIHVRRARRQVRFSFPSPPRSGATVVEIRGLVKAYGDKVVYDGADFTAARGERIALVGPNGAGKTTLLRVLAGALRLDAGTRRIGANVTIAYYAQHQVEALDLRRTVLEEIESGAPDAMRPGLRGLLGAFLFSGEDVDKRIAVLSGGERARVALCKMLLRPANLLLLDEPTNHLDLASREVLEQALEDYSGTMVFISHDRYFIGRIANRVCEVRDGRLELHLGSYEDYLDDLDARRLAPGADARAPRGAPSGPEAEGGARDEAGGGAGLAEGIGRRGGSGAADGGARRTRGRGPRAGEREERRRRERELRPLRERIRRIETEIAEEEERLREILAMQADPRVYSDGEKARRAAHDRRAAEERIAWLYDEWSALGAHIETVESGSRESAGGGIGESEGRKGTEGRK